MATKSTSRRTLAGAANKGAVGKGAAKGNVKSGKSARELSEALRVQLAQKDRRRTRLIFGGAIAAFALALVLVVVFIIVSNPNSETNLRKKIQEAGDVPSLFNEDGSFTVSKNGGGKDKAIKGAVNLEIYNDFLCPGCGGFERSYGDTLEELVATGKVNIIYHPLAWFDIKSPLDKNGKNDAYSTRTASAAVYVAQNTPDKYMAFVKAMYAAANQPCEGYIHENTDYCLQRPEHGYDPETGSNEKIKEHIIEAGISKQIAEQAVSGKYEKYAKAVSDYVHGLRKITATPAIFINGEHYEPSGTPAKFKEKVLLQRTSSSTAN
ncbi:MAG: thioredoxin domain-containing protein [Candidatus Ancillula trichonymphae]|nr:thioredoxin domain-containing protein [Candidatus Ancillula trichonymphae]